ncbi:hypothetical protein BT69DRAFT_1286636 [Atractiella rhizophila]|nr:hypothetical protein BT69DRAFT_1286636 [Atractiella rhizophila]
MVHAAETHESKLLHVISEDEERSNLESQDDSESQEESQEDSSSDGSNLEEGTDEDEGEYFDWDAFGNGSSKFTLGVLGRGCALAESAHSQRMIPTATTSTRNQNGRRRKSRQKKAPESVFAAKVGELATDHADGDDGRLAHLDQTALARIRKALALGNHPGTGEAEAKAALRMAAQLMAKLSIKEADVMASESLEEKIQRAGCSKVVIVHKKGGKVPNQAWANTCVSAMTTWFDVKSFSTAWTYKLEWTFYGIAENTAAAALAFEMVFNLILEWGRTTVEAKGNRNSYYSGVADGLYRMAREDKLNEEKAAEEAERKEMADKIKREEEARRQEIERLRDLAQEQEEAADSRRDEKADHKPEARKVKIEEDATIEPKIKAEVLDGMEGLAFDMQRSPSPADGTIPHFVSNSEGEEEVNADFANAEEDEELADIDFEAEMERSRLNFLEQRRKEAEKKRAREERLREEEKRRKTEKDASLKQEVKLEDDPKWKNSQQLTLFRSNSVTIADSWKESNKIKLRKGRKFTAPKINHAAYNKGKTDAKKIDVRRRKIEA